MEGIETADAILSKIFPGTDQIMMEREEKAGITIKRLKMDRVERLYEPLLPVSLMIDYTKKNDHK